MADDFELYDRLRRAEKTVSRLQGAMRIAAGYQASPQEGEDEVSVLKRQIAGIQAALLKGAEEAYRPPKKGKRGR
jgi:hypothetical protein